MRRPQQVNGSPRCLNRTGYLTAWSKPLDILIVHPNFPGQFRRLVPELIKRQHRVFGVSDAAQAATSPFPEVPLFTYRMPEATAKVHPWAVPFNQAVVRAQCVLDVLAPLERQGLEPDVILCHPGWGDAFFLRQFFPHTQVIGLFEYYYRTHGADVGFDPEFPRRFNDAFRLHAQNAVQLLALESCDIGICPTEWQRSRFPESQQAKLQVLHEGIDTQACHPDPEAQIVLADGTHLSAGDEVLTFVSRVLEPYRGFHTFMRALPDVLAQRPDCHVIIVGHEQGPGYGPPPADAPSWKAKLLEEIGPLDPKRVHFTGFLPYSDYLKVLQISRAHVYFTYPFILSWSLLESMATGCLVIASATPPVREVIEHEHNGLLVPFKDVRGLARRIVDTLSHPDAYQTLRQAARTTIQERYDFANITLPQYLDLIQGAF